MKNKHILRGREACFERRHDEEIGEKERRGLMEGTEGEINQTVIIY